MAENLMRNPEGPKPRPGQAGFSMIEMLMTAFILAIGLLGLCMLQTMSLRAGRGSTSLTTAVHVAEGVMDQVEQEGRLSWLNQVNASGAVIALPNLVYIPLAVGASLPQTFNLHGNVTNLASTDPTVSSALFTVTTTHVDDVGAGPKGQISDYSVLVQFTDNANQPRKVLVSRRILHG